MNIIARRGENKNKPISNEPKYEKRNQIKFKQEIIIIFASILDDIL